MSLPLTGWRATPPAASGTSLRGAVATAISRTSPLLRVMRIDSAAWPSTAPPTPSLTATESTPASPLSTSCVTITPDTSAGTVRISITAG